MLRSNKSLTTLNLSHNDLNSEAAIAIVEAITLGGASAILTWFSLADNRIGSEAGAAIAKLIRVTKGIKHLDLSGNAMGDRTHRSSNSHKASSGTGESIL